MSLRTPAFNPCTPLSKPTALLKSWKIRNKAPKTGEIYCIFEQCDMIDFAEATFTTEEAFRSWRCCESLLIHSSRMMKNDRAGSGKNRGYVAPAKSIQ